MKRGLLLTVSWLVAVAAGCGGDQGRRASVPGAAAPVTALPAAVPADQASLARSNNAFAFALWSRVGSQQGNLAVSPASISLALGMTYGGARGETATQMRRTLALELADDHVHAGLGDTVRRWNGEGARPYELKVANRIFSDRSTRFEPAFMTLTRDAYGAPAEPVDFQGAPDPSRVRINGWVADQTRTRIRDLLPQGSIDSDVRMVLVNAIYFKGAWAQRFETSATREAPFHAAGGDVDARMMSQTARFGVAELDGVQVLEMPYVGDDLSMIVVLPEAQDGLGAVEARLDAATFDRWVAAVHEVDDVQVTLPRFKIDPSSPLALSQPLRAMGMPLAFERGADFTGMMSREQGPLWIDQVWHKAFVEVNEEGTEAAAATAVVMTTESASESPVFTADHPFLFFVRDRHTGGVIFMGRVARPAA